MIFGSHAHVPRAQGRHHICQKLDDTYLSKIWLLYTKKLNKYLVTVKWLMHVNYNPFYARILWCFLEITINKFELCRIWFETCFCRHSKNMNLLEIKRIGPFWKFEMVQIWIEQFLSTNLMVSYVYFDFR